MYSASDRARVRDRDQELLVVCRATLFYKHYSFIRHVHGRTCLDFGARPLCRGLGVREPHELLGFLRIDLFTCRLTLCVFFKFKTEVILNFGPKLGAPHLLAD